MGRGNKKTTTLKVMFCHLSLSSLSAETKEKLYLSPEAVDTNRMPL